MSDRTAVRCGEPIFGCGLLDITPTILRSLDVAIPEGLRGRALDWPRVEGHQAHVG